MQYLQIDSKRNLSQKVAKWPKFSLHIQTG